MLKNPLVIRLSDPDNTAVTATDDIIIGSYEEVLPHISIRLLSTAEQPELIKSVVSVLVVGNVYAVFNYGLKEDEEKEDEESEPFYIKEDQLRGWGIPVEKLFEDVRARMEDDPDENVIIESIGDALSLDEDVMAPYNMFYVMTNRRRRYGAATMLYKDALKTFAENTGRGFYIIPSSVHEILLVPETLGIPAKELKEMLTDVNDTIVSPEDILDKDVYHYSEADGLTVAA